MGGTAEGFAGGVKVKGEEGEGFEVHGWWGFGGKGRGIGEYSDGRCESYGWFFMRRVWVVGNTKRGCCSETQSYMVCVQRMV